MKQILPIISCPFVEYCCISLTDTAKYKSASTQKQKLTFYLAAANVCLLQNFSAVD
jgi:hypothetical protein